MSIAEHPTGSRGQRKREVAEEIWLLYFNTVLYEKGLISERERNHMRLLIERRRPSAAHS